LYRTDARKVPRHRAVIGVAEGTNEGDNIEAELMLRQSKTAFGRDSGDAGRWSRGEKQRHAEAAVNDAAR
jgi:hypothetical protein